MKRKNWCLTLKSMCSLHIKGKLLSESVTPSCHSTCVLWENRTTMKLESEMQVDSDEIYENRCK